MYANQNFQTVRAVFLFAVRFVILIAGFVFEIGAIQAQVINFDVPGGAGAANYSGQGAYSDAGNNYWNPIWGGTTTGATNVLSDGVTASPITFTSQLGGTFGTQGAQGTTAGLQQPYEYNNATLQTDSINHVPAGTYNLYLYGINNTGTRGTIFTVTTDEMGPTSQATVNTPISRTNFVLGADYVIFTNIIVGAAGTISFTWIGNPNVTVAGNNEADLNAAQLIYVGPNNAVTANSGNPDFGPSVLTFNPSMSMSAIQNYLNGVFSIEQNNQFGTQRFVYLFMPGAYSNLDVNLGYYTHVIGLGQNPDATSITGNVHSEGVLANNNATVNFWRGCENFAVTPTNNSTMTWAVSQDTWLRRMHIKGSLNLSDTEGGAYSSGGFLADSKIDSTVSSITQQQWLSRNDVWGNWSGGVWNMVFVGVSNAPGNTWPNPPYTVVTNTPLVREKPYLSLDGTNFVVMVPNLQTNSFATTWNNGPTPATEISITNFYLAQPGIDNSATINAALNSGLHLILTPGVYQLTNSIQVTRAETIVLGLGYPTLVPTNGNPSMVISDVDGVKIGGIIFDAGTTVSPSLLEVGAATNSSDHSADPIFLYDICSRVGGATAGQTTTCVTINANDVFGDNLWLWRADHGSGVGWTQNSSNNGLVVNGNRVTMYGLFVEHHEQYQTLWNGNWGRVYFYQSELPYDAPNQSSWTHNSVNGYASYKVANSVTSHQAYGLGVYGVFQTSNVKCFNAIETPTNSQQVNIHDMINVLIEAQTGNEMTHIINGIGNTLNSGVTTATANSLWTNPMFNVSAAFDVTGTNVAIILPTESWHTYQLQYENLLTGGNWLNLGSPIGGNDSLETLSAPISNNEQFFRIAAH